MKKIKTLANFLKENWLTNFQMQMIMKSSSADRDARRLRKNPPEGFCMVQRLKDCETRCFEYKLEKIGD